MVQYRYLLNHQKQGENPENDEVDDVQEAFEHPTYKRKMNARSIIETIAMLSLCLLIGQYLDGLQKVHTFNYQHSYGVCLQV